MSGNEVRWNVPDGHLIAGFTPGGDLVLGYALVEFLDDDTELAPRQM
jgi:hypothetical protein